MNTTKLLAALAAVAALSATQLGAISTAEAAAHICPPEVDSLVATNIGCWLPTTFDNDSNPPSLVNSEKLFGHDDWQYSFKLIEDGYSSPFVNLTGDDQSGTWALSAGFWDDYSDLMFLLKGAAKNEYSPIAYLIKPGEYTGTYSSPFLTDNGTQAISHLTVYYRGNGTTTVPEPSVLALLGLGLVGFGLARRRRT